MKIQHYEGPLGVFDYNDSEFKLYDDFGNSPYLRYVGKETDGSKIKIPEGVTNYRSMFAYCEFLKQPPVIPDGVTNCSGMFRGCKSLEQAPVIPESVTDCNYMFEGCESLQQPPVVPDGVTDCEGMFAYCKSLQQVPVIPNRVRNCKEMFRSCHSLQYPPVIPDSVENCHSMFCGCKSLQQAPVIPGNVTNCERMFEDCHSLEQAPDIPEYVMNCIRMFCNCKSLKRPPDDIPIRVLSCESMFEGCESLQQPPMVSAWAVNCDSMFRGCVSLQQPPVIPITAKNCLYMFENCTSLQQPPEIPDSVINCAGMFNNCTSLRRPPKVSDDVFAFDFDCMFKGCPFEDNLIKWQTHTFTYAERKALQRGEEVTLRDYVTRDGEHLDVKGKFASCIDENGNECFGFVPSGDEKLKQRLLLDAPSENAMQHYEGELGIFDYDDSEFRVAAGKNNKLYLDYVGKETDGTKIKIPEGIVDCNNMFSYCEHLKQPPIIPDGVKRCDYMFYGCKSLQQPPVLPKSVESFQYMFKDCPFDYHISQWGTHKFTKDEQKALLQGKDVTLKNYTTRGGKIMNIPGKFGFFRNKQGHECFGFVSFNNEKTKQRPLLDTPSESEQSYVNNKTF